MTTIIDCLYFNLELLEYTIAVDTNSGFSRGFVEIHQEVAKWLRRYGLESQEIMSEVQTELFSISTLWIRLCVTTIPHVYDDPDIIKLLFNDHNYRLSES